MRLFFRRRVPYFERVLLVESGSRALIEGMLPGLFKHHGDRLRRIDLVTCFAGLPEGYDPSMGRVYRVHDYPNSAARKRLYQELAANRYSVCGIICSAEPIMTKWKWALALQVPAKVFVLNENGDYFFFHIANWKTILHVVLFRAGLTGADAVRTLGRLPLFPFALLYLILYAGFAHARAALNRDSS